MCIYICIYIYIYICKCVCVCVSYGPLWQAKVASLVRLGRLFALGMVARIMVLHLGNHIQDSDTVFGGAHGAS